MIAGWLALAALAQQTAVPPRTDALVLHDEFAACMVEPYEHDFEWVPAGDSYQCGTETVSRSAVEALRRIALASRQEPPDFLATLGVTPAAVEQHRAEILGQFEGAEGYGLNKHPLPARDDLENVLRFDVISQALRDELRYFRKSSSTTFVEIRVTLPGEVPITITSEGQGDTGWLLPWQIETPDRTWRSWNIEIPRAILPLLDASSPNRYVLDGTSYWSDYFWTSSFLWWEIYDYRLDAIGPASRYETLPGYADVAPWFHVESSRPGSGGDAYGVVMAITAPSDGPIQHVRWWNPLENGTPSSSWTDFLVAWDRSVEAVRWHDWIEAWRLSGNDRRVRLLAVGRNAFVRSDRDENVMLAWNHAGLRGEPGVEIELQRGEQTAATVFLSCDEPGALIVSAIPGAGDHWLDRMDVAFHPHTPTYLRVDASGKPELRAMAPFSDPKEGGRRGCR